MSQEWYLTQSPERGTITELGAENCTVTLDSGQTRIVTKAGNEDRWPRTTGIQVGVVPNPDGSYLLLGDDLFDDDDDENEDEDEELEGEAMEVDDDWK